jgi:hypothetical protein
MLVIGLEPPHEAAMQRMARATAVQIADSIILDFADVEVKLVLAMS